MRKQSDIVTTTPSIDVKPVSTRFLLVTYATLDCTAKRVCLKLSGSYGMQQVIHNILCDNDERYYAIVEVVDCKSTPLS